MKKFKKVMLDLDGVLADFDSAFEDIAKEPIIGYEAKHGIHKFWQTVYEKPNFFRDLKPFNHLHKLIDLCQEMSEEPVCILSSPSRVNTPLCMIQKREWINYHLGDSFPAIFTKDKHNYAAPDTLLIDDFINKIEKWEKAGGIGYLFNPKTPFSETVDFFNKK